ncbi:hydroxyacylglutathione hydrolase [Alkalibacterium olivapovliticus]|uniref:Hydroxyacylglutathione hydrolase n=1 Tax=Alkalibacterium olivapovliticus TaxID=99907 RepID=A0A2T0W6F0_9LACT|nr:hydroxyacylglutathione hydrolase [Alkalibacterium olivapovliticus]PRY82275.1 hydroxyacylglutathione hydrolase [Alkalibacterium olivapovliticus]
MNITPVKAFSDNYIWVIEEKQDAIVVDPGESEGVLRYLKDNQLNLHAILLTHEHDDHIGGVRAILTAFPETPVYGPKETERLADHVVEDGDFFTLLCHSFHVLKTAGHSHEHISFLTGDSLFCGDALFSGGCGRVFTGDYQAQYDALQTFSQLDDKVHVYAGHEYTQTNLRFAQSVEPSNQAINEELDEVNRLREKDIPTLPSTIGKERRINLLMQAENVEDFALLRTARDQFS